MKKIKTIIVLMSTYNGEAYLNEQIESLIWQTDVNCKIFVRDDGSQDRTSEILDYWQEKGVLTWFRGKNLGAGLSFFELINLAPSADYYAFCDQDDIWHKNKLAKSVKSLQNVDGKKPALYFSRVKIVNSDLQTLGFSNKNSAKDLGSVFIGSHAIGCTMVFNNRLLNLLKKYTPKNTLHDAWTIRLCVAVGGKIIFDTTPSIDYRQHGNNVVGVNKNKIDRLKRLTKFAFKKRNKKSRLAGEILEVYSQVIPQKNNILLNQIYNYNKSPRSKLKLIKNRNVRREKVTENFLFHLSVIFGVY